MSGPGEVLASIVSGFGEETGADGRFALVELDAASHRAADGTVQTQFYPDQPAYLLVHGEAGLQVIGSGVSSGALRFVETVTRTAEEEVAFDHLEQTHELGKIPAGSVRASWIGRDGGLQVDGRTIRATRVPCLGTVRYPYTAQRYRLEPPEGLVLSGEQRHLVRAAFSFRE